MLCYRFQLKARRSAERLQMALMCYPWWQDQVFAFCHLMLQPSQQWTKVNFPWWLSKLFWTYSEMERASPGCSSFHYSQAGYPEKGENALCSKTQKQYSLMPSLNALQLTSRGEGDESSGRLIPCCSHQTPCTCKTATCPQLVSQRWDTWVSSEWEEPKLIHQICKKIKINPSCSLAVHSTVSYEAGCVWGKLSNA